MGVQPNGMFDLELDSERAGRQGCQGGRRVLRRAHRQSVE